MRLSPRITLVPIAHGRSAIAAHLRRLFAANRFDCVAADIPELFQDDIGPAVAELPLVQAVVAREVGEEQWYYIPADPCDAAIEGIRQAAQNRLPFFCIGDDPQLTEAIEPLPDDYAVGKIGYEAWAALAVSAMPNPESGSADDLAGVHLAARLQELSARHENILALVHFRHCARTLLHFHRNTFEDARPKKSFEIERHYINPDHLYFALGELPFITGKFERERLDPLAEPVDLPTEIKNLFRETRDGYFDDEDAVAALSPVRIQSALTFVRNLTVQSGCLIPSLFDLVEAAKGVGGNAFALRILQNARYYPYLPFELGVPLLGVGIDRIKFPEAGESMPAVNLFRDSAITWRQVSIKPDPSLERKKKYRYAWNPFGMCSHVPEDEKIERFNSHVRLKAKQMLMEEFARSEKFTTSVRDGIDIRETLRNWHTGSIYVREIPPSHGKIDTVVIIFDDRHDDHYPQRATWYAEHPEESTLSFYATDPFSDLIGPGIARCRYGGLSLLFPPRPVPNIFELAEGQDFPNLAAQLTYGALLFSGERIVAYAAERKPSTFIRGLARRMKKQLLWIPLATFSNETLRGLRRFHILNGKEVRSWATRFIGE